jgi:hypothetical protein
MGGTIYCLSRDVMGESVASEAEVSPDGKKKTKY